MFLPVSGQQVSITPWYVFSTLPVVRLAALMGAQIKEQQLADLVNSVTLSQSWSSSNSYYKFDNVLSCCDSLKIPVTAKIRVSASCTFAYQFPWQPIKLLRKGHVTSRARTQNIRVVQSAVVITFNNQYLLHGSLPAAPIFSGGVNVVQPAFWRDDLKIESLK